MASFNDTYTATGTEGTALTRSGLIGKTILICFQESYPLKPVVSSPNPGEYTFNSSTGVFGFGASLELNQVIQTVYK